MADQDTLIQLQLLEELDHIFSHSAVVVLLRVEGLAMISEILGEDGVSWCTVFEYVLG